MFPRRSQATMPASYHSRKLRPYLLLGVITLVLIFVGIRYDALPGRPLGPGHLESTVAGDSPISPPSPLKPAVPAPPDQSIETATKRPESTQSETTESVDWSRFAYTQYVTNSVYLCNSVMLFDRLQQVGSRADRVMMYPSWMMGDDSRSKPDDRRLLLKARDEYSVRLVAIEVQTRPGQDPTWGESFTKLLAFNQTQYARVLSLDSDANVLQNMDELFLLPPSPVAMPRAYWLYPEEKKLASHIVLLQPSATEFARIMDRVNTAAAGDYDMEILNQLYGDSALVLPHRPYGLLTREYFREPGNHTYYLGSDREKWDPVAVYKEAKYLHFSDWPMPKPWLPHSEELRLSVQPKCYTTDGVESCAERELWNGWRNEFKERRERICGTGTQPTRRMMN